MKSKTPLEVNGLEVKLNGSEVMKTNAARNKSVNTEETLMLSNLSFNTFTVYLED